MYNPTTDDIQLFLMSYQLHKRQDTFGKTEFYCTCVVGDNGKYKDDPETHYHPSGGVYQPLKKGQDFPLVNPLVIYNGDPKDELVYAVNTFDSQTSVHDEIVQATSSIISAAVKATVALVGGPIPATIGVAVEAANKVITDTAIKHGDELFATFQGSLTLNDPFDKGPYSLALPKISLQSEDVTVRLFVARNASVREAAKPTLTKKSTLPIGDPIVTRKRTVVKPRITRR